MSPRWLFFPAPASSGSDWSDAWASSEFLGSCVADGNAGSNGNPFSLVTGDLIGKTSGNEEFVRASSTQMDTGTIDRFTMYYTHGSRYMVWFLDTFGWQKLAMPVWYQGTRTTWSGANFFTSGTNVGDFSPIVFAMFTADPGDVSTWTDYNGPTS